MLKSLLEKLFRTMCPLVFSGPTYTDYEVPDSRQIIAPYDGWAMYLATNINDVYSLSIQSEHIVNISPSYDTKWGVLYTFLVGRGKQLQRQLTERVNLHYGLSERLCLNSAFDKGVHYAI